MGGPHLHLAGQLGEPAQRGVLGAGEFVGAVLGDQVGAGGRADQQRPAGEDSDFAVAVEQEKSHVLVGVSRSQQGTQPQSAQVHLVTVMQPRVRELAMAGRRRQHLCAAGCPELVCAGKEVGMQVGVGGERHRQPALGCGGMHRAQING